LFRSWSFVSVAEQPRHYLAEVDRRVRLPPDTLLTPCDAAGVATCLSSRRDGFESPTGRWFAGRHHPARHPPASRASAGSHPAGPTELVPWSSLECSPRSHRGGRWFESSRDYWIVTPVAQRRRQLPDVERIAGSSPAGGTACGVDWSLEASTVS